MNKKISVVLAVFNEEGNLRDCLSSVADLAWEIVVVDGGSQDKTIAIAKEFNARIIQTNNPKIFHINKNKAIREAKGDWILQLDADERVSRELAQEIQSVTAQTNSLNGYWIPRKNFFLNKFLSKGGQYPDYTLRLYKNGKGILPAKDVHEQAQVEGERGYLKHDLLHLRDTSFSKYLAGLNRYTDIIAYQLKESKTHINTKTALNFILFKPLYWFVLTYIRHRGYVDGFAGFIFSLFSSFRFPIAYMKYSIDSKKGKES